MSAGIVLGFVALAAFSSEVERVRGVFGELVSGAKLVRLVGNRNSGLGVCLDRPLVDAKHTR